MSQNSQFNYTTLLASVMGQIGCLVVFLVIISLVVGMVVDKFLGTDGIFTALFMLGSVPITLFLVVRVSISASRRAQEQVEQKMATKPERDNEV